MSQLHILFVCTGNICRSPTAERLAVAYAVQRGITDFRASSAGTRAVIGHPVHPNAVESIKQMGGDTADFAARKLTPRIASDADLVIAMTTAHRDAVLEIAPSRLHRTFTLFEAAHIASLPGVRSVADLADHRSHVADHGPSDILDPIGQNLEYFSMIGSQIAGLLPPVLELCRRG